MSTNNNDFYFDKYEQLSNNTVHTLLMALTSKMSLADIIQTLEEYSGSYDMVSEVLTGFGFTVFFEDERKDEISSVWMNELTKELVKINFSYTKKFVCTVATL